MEKTNKSKLVGVRSVSFAKNGIGGAAFINALVDVTLRGSEITRLLSIMFFPTIDREKGKFTGVDSVTTGGQAVIVSNLGHLIAGSTENFVHGARVFGDIEDDLLAECNNRIDFWDSVGQIDTPEELARRRQAFDELRTLEDELGLWDHEK